MWGVTLENLGDHLKQILGVRSSALSKTTEWLLVIKRSGGGYRSARNLNGGCWRGVRESEAKGGPGEQRTGSYEKIC